MPSNFSDREDISAIIKARRARQLALAILKRSKEAGIPDRYMRIDQDSFSSVLSPEFHDKMAGIKDFSNFVYKVPEFLLNRDFITIDGGNFSSRQMAGFAILFRMIAYDKRGQYFDCNSLNHKFQTINSTEEITRNDLAEELKQYDILFIGEFNKMNFSPHFEIGSFFDEVLTERINNSRPTVISFVNPVISEKVTKEAREKLALEGKMDSSCGTHLAWLSLTPQTTDKVLRVRVKNL